MTEITIPQISTTERYDRLRWIIKYTPPEGWWIFSTPPTREAVLQQEIEITEYEDGVPVRQKHEWRDIPSVVVNAKDGNREASE